MVTIQTSIIIHVPIEVAFDAERNVSLHAETQAHRGERAVDGRTSGLVELGDEVEWEATHFGVKQRLRVRITEMRSPEYFRDEMMRGAFRMMSHEHHFADLGDGRTEKRDVFTFAAPLGPLGWMAERLFLARYMRTFLERKNRELKVILERGS